MSGVIPSRRLLRYVAVAIVGALIATAIVNLLTVAGPVGVVLEFLAAFIVFLGLILLVDRPGTFRRTRS
jgi:hypothetical protein